MSSASGAMKPICRGTVRRMACVRRPAGGWPKLAARNTRSRASPATKISPRSAATPGRPAGRRWRNPRWRRSLRPFPSAASGQNLTLGTRRLRLESDLFRPSAVAAAVVLHTPNETFAASKVNLGSGRTVVRQVISQCLAPNPTIPPCRRRLAQISTLRPWPLSVAL